MRFSIVKESRKIIISEKINIMITCVEKNDMKLHLVKTHRNIFLGTRENSPEIRNHIKNFRVDNLFRFLLLGIFFQNPKQYVIPN